MEKQTFLSVIVPFYKVKEDWFFACIDSLVNASVKKKNYTIQAIIIDDCSPTPLPELQDRVKNFPPNFSIQVIHNEKNLGLAGARNVGLKLIPDDHFVCFLDSDDLLVEIPRLDDLDIVLGSHVYFGSKETVSLEELLKFNAKPLYEAVDCHNHFLNLVVRNLYPVSAYFIKRNVIGSLTFRESLTSCEDWGFWIELFDQCYKNKVTFGKSSLLVNAIRKSQGSMSSSVEKIFRNKHDLWLQLPKSLKSTAFLKTLSDSFVLTTQCLYPPQDDKPLFARRSKLFFLTVFLFVLGWYEGLWGRHLFLHLGICGMSAVAPGVTKKRLVRRYEKRAMLQLQLSKKS